MPGYPVAALPRPTRLMQFLPRAGGGAVEAALSVYLEPHMCLATLWRPCHA